MSRQRKLNRMAGLMVRVGFALMAAVVAITPVVADGRVVGEPATVPVVGEAEDPAAPSVGPAAGPARSWPEQRLYSKAEIDAARQELDAVLADYETAIDLILENTLRQIGPDRPNVTAGFQAVVEDSRLRLRSEWQTFDEIPAQNLPTIMAQSRSAGRQLKQMLHILNTQAFDPRMPVDPVTNGSSQQFLKAPTRFNNDCKDNDADFDDKCFSFGTVECAARDIAACVNVCDTLTAAFSISSESTPDDIHVVAAGFGVNVPSPIKIGVQILKVVAKLACGIIECSADNFLECSNNDVNRIVNEEKRFTDDFELDAQSVRLEAKIDAGNGQILDEIAVTAGLIMAVDDKLKEEERFTSDVELNDHEANVLSAINSLEQVSCNVEQLLYVQQSKRSRLVPACATTAPRIGDALDLRGQSRRGKKGKKGGSGGGGDPPVGPTGPLEAAGEVVDVAMPSQSDSEAIEPVPVLQYLGTLQIERQLLDGELVPTLYLPAERGGLIEQIRELVWETIRAQQDLNIAPEGTRLAEAEARVADRRLAERSYVEAYREYSRAYRSLVTPGP